jgi:hypothetical protein
MFSCASAIASTVDFIGSVVTLVWYMVVFYGLWKLKDVRYEAPVRHVPRPRYSRGEWDLFTAEEQKKFVEVMTTIHIHDV